MSIRRQLSRSRSPRSRREKRRSRSRHRSSSIRRDRTSPRRRSTSRRRAASTNKPELDGSDSGSSSSDSDEDPKEKDTRRRKQVRSRDRGRSRDQGRRKSGQTDRGRSRDRRGKSSHVDDASSSSSEPEQMNSEEEEEWLEKRRLQRQQIQKKHLETSQAEAEAVSARSPEKEQQSGKRLRPMTSMTAPGTPAYVEVGGDDIFAPFAQSPSPDSPNDEDVGTMGDVNREDEHEKPDTNDVLDKLGAGDASESESEAEKTPEKKEEKEVIVAGINVGEIRKKLDKEKAQLRDFVRKTKNAFEEAEEKGQEAVNNVIADYNPDLRDDWDDEEGYYKPRVGEIIDNRFKVFEECAGKGVFSNVVKCREIGGEKRPVAIKIIRANEMMKKAAEKEVDMLRRLNEADPDDRRHVVRLFNVFTYRNHMCLVFELMGHNVRQALKLHGKGRGLTLSAVHAYAWQLFIALRLIKKTGIVHADIKPDNMLIGGPDGKDLKKLKICDLGSGLDVNTECDITSYLVSRFYRAPEIILGQKYDFAIDVWAVGCTLYELLIGKILFNGNSNNDMLKQIADVCGGTGKFMKRGKFHKMHFTREGHLIWQDRDSYSRKTVRRTIKDLRSKINIEKKIISRCRPEHKQKAKQLADLIKKCLILDPKKRICPDEAFDHPFIKEPVPDIVNK